jgi:hypothetical protein
MVFVRHWPKIVHKYDLEYNDTLEFKIQAFVLKTKIYKINTSTAKLHTFPNHG